MHEELTHLGQRSLTAVDRRTGEIVAIDRQTAASIGVTEQVAGKDALQQAAADIAERLLPKTVPTKKRKED